MNLSGKKICVCGMARSGVGAAFLALKMGADVTVTDTKDEDKLKHELKILKDLKINTVCGQNPDIKLLNGTDLIIISPGIPLDIPFLKTAREKNITILPEIEFASMFFKGNIAAITGTNGKTTTTTLVGEIMKKVNPDSMALGNIGTAFSSYAINLPKEAYAVLEVSSFQLEAIINFKPKAAAIIQITPDHLDRHKTMENYISIKAKIFKNQDENDFAILNRDDEACLKIAEKCKAKIIFFSKNKLNEGIYLNGTKIIAAYNGTVNEITDISRLKIPGMHNVENVMAAVSICTALNVPADIISETVESFKGVPHRLEFVGEVNGVRFINDSKATNTDSAIKGLLAINGSIILIGGGFGKNAKFDEWVKLFNGKVKRLIVIGEAADEIIETCKEYKFYEFEKADSLKEAVKRSLLIASTGDSVLLSPACASWDMFDNFEQRGDMFKSYVKELKKI